MKNRKWQRVLSWILTLTMLFGTFEGTGFRAFAAEDEVAAEETADDEATAVEEEADSEDTDVNDDAEASDEEEADDEAEAEEVEDAEDAEEADEAEEAEEAVEAEEEEADEADVTEEETDAPEEEDEAPAEGAAAAVDDSKDQEVSTWGAWYEEARILILNRMDAVPKASALWWHSAGAKSWSIYKATDDTHENLIYKDGDNYYFRGMNVEFVTEGADSGKIMIYGTPNADLEEANYVLAPSDQAEFPAGTQGDDHTYVLTINIGRTMHVYARTENTGAQAWGSYAMTTGDNKVKDGYDNTDKHGYPFLNVVQNGEGIDNNVLKFKAVNGEVPEAERDTTAEFDSMAAQSTVTWYLYEANADDYTLNAANGKRDFKDGTLVATVPVGGERVYVNGVAFRNDSGVLTIDKSANKTLTSDTAKGDAISDEAKLFMLIAKNDSIESNVYADVYGEYPMFIKIAPLDGALNWTEPERTKADWTVSEWDETLNNNAGGYKVVAGDLAAKTYYRYFKAVGVDYQVDDEAGVNKVARLSFTTSDLSNRPLTNVTVALADNTDLGGKKNDKDCFVVKPEESFGLLAKEEDNSSFTVEPVTGLATRVQPYVADIIVYADQLPVGGITVGTIEVLVSNGFTLTSKGVAVPTTLLTGADLAALQYVDPVTLEPLKTYVFDAATITAGNSFEAFDITVTGSDAAAGAFFEAMPEEAIDADVFLPGINNLTYEKSFVNFSGKILASDWMSKNAVTGSVDGTAATIYADATKNVYKGTKYLVYDENTDSTIYYIPLIAKDKNKTRACFLAKFTIKPADLTFDLDGTDISAEHAKYSWHATAGRLAYVEADGASPAERTLVISNPNEEDIQAVVVIYDPKKNDGAQDDGQFFFADGDKAMTVGDDGTQYKRIFTIPGKDQISIVIRPAAGLEAGLYTAKVGVYWSNVKTNLDPENPVSVLEQPLDAIKFIPVAPKEADTTLSFTVKANTVAEIVEPADSSLDGVANEDGTTWAKARDIYIGVGETGSWTFKYEGKLANDFATNGARFDIVKAGEVTSLDNELTKAGENGEINFVDEGTGLKAWGFQWSGLKGELSTTGAKIDTSDDENVVNRDNFTVCIKATYAGAGNGVEANADKPYVYCYLNIHIVPTDKAIVMTGSDVTLKGGDVAKTLKAAGDDVANATTATADSMKGVAESRNLVFETSQDSVDVTSSTITMKNTSKVEMKGMKLTFKDVKKVGGGLVADPFAGITFEEKSAAAGETIELGDIAPLASVQFDVNVKALHFLKDFADGTYVAQIEVTGADIVKQSVVVILKVKKAPKLQSLQLEYNSTGTAGVNNRTASDKANWFTAVPGASRAAEAGKSAQFVSTDANTLSGEKITVSATENLNIQLIAKGADGEWLRRGQVDFVTPLTETIPGSDLAASESGFELSTDGKLTGKAVKPGTYYFTIHFKDNRTAVDAEAAVVRDGYADIAIYVPGDVTLSLSTLDKGASKAVGAGDVAWMNDYLYVFEGIVEGGSAAGVPRKEVIVHNNSTTKTATNLSYRIKDGNFGAAGSADMFDVSLETENIAPNMNSKLVVSAKGENVPAGLYYAIIEVSSSNSAPVSFPVMWAVARELKTVAPGADKTISRTGAKDYSLTFEAEGAGVAYDDKDELQADDADWYWNKTYAAGGLLKQNVYWGIKVKNDDGSDTALITLAEALNEMGFNAQLKMWTNGEPAQLVNDPNFPANRLGTFDEADPDVTKAEYYKAGIENNTITNEHVLYIALEDNRNSTLFNTIKSALLTGGGNYSFTAVAFVDTQYTPKSEIKMLPAQSAEMDITLQVVPNEDVHVETERAYDGFAKVAVVDEHKNTLAKKNDDAWRKVIKEYTKVTEYAFRELHEDYWLEDNGYMEGYAQHTFTVVSELPDVPLRVSAKVTDDADGKVESSAFTVAPAEGEWIDHTAAETYTKKNYTVSVKPELPVKDEPYTGYLIISGIGFQDIKIPLSVTVKADSYLVGGASHLPDADTIEFIGDEGFDTKALPVDTAAKTDGTSATIGDLVILSVGNRLTNVTRVEEVDGPGADASVLSKDDQKLVLEKGEVKIERGGFAAKGMDPVYDVTAPSMLDNDYTIINMYMKSKKTVQSGSTYVRVVYTDENTDTGVNYLTVKVNYCVYADDIEWSMNPYQDVPYQMGADEVSEGYEVKDNVVVFEIENKDTHTGDASYALYNTAVTVEINVDSDFDMFTVNGKNTHATNGTVTIEADKIMPGDKATFTIEPVKGLNAGDNAWQPNIIVKPANSSAKEQELVFNVVRNDDFSTYAFSAREDLDGVGLLDSTVKGYLLPGGWHNRLQDTLVQMVGADTPGCYVVGVTNLRTAETGVLAGGNAVTTDEAAGCTLANGFLINVNDEEDTDFDILIYEEGTIIVVTTYKKCNVGRYDNKIDNPNYDAASKKHEFKSLTFNVLKWVNYDFYDETNEVYLNDYDMLTGENSGIVINDVRMGSIKGTDVPTSDFVKAYPGKTFFSFLVGYGKAFSTAAEISGILGSYSEDYVKLGAYSENKALDVFMDEDDKETIVGESIILKDRNLIPKFHTHSYYRDEDGMVVIGDQIVDKKEVVTWHWNGSEEAGYDSAEVVLHCVDPLCNDYEGSAVTLDKNSKPYVTTTSERDQGSCTVGGFMSYEAEVYWENTQMRYVSQNEAMHEGTVDKHVWSFAWKDVVFHNLDDYENAYAEVVKTCTSPIHDVERDGEVSVTVSSNSFVFEGSKPTCDEKGIGHYVFTFNDEDIPEEDILAGKNIVSSNDIEVPPTGHIWIATDAVWDGGSISEMPEGAVLYLTCSNNSAHTASVNVAKAMISEERDGDVSVTYKAIGYYDGQQVEYSVTFYSHTEHEWTVSFNWVKLAKTKEEVEVTAEATCAVGGEVVPCVVMLTSTTDGGFITYTASTTDPAGNPATESKIVDLATGEEVTHPHEWYKPVWDFSGTTKDEGKAAVVFVCKVNENEKKTVNAVVVKDKEKEGKYVCYTATAKNPNEGGADLVKKFYLDLTVDPAVVKEGTPSGGSGGTISEPEDSQIVNLFYTDAEIEVALPEGVDVKGGSGKWTGFFSIDESGTVTVTGNRKDAAKAANSLIVLPVKDDDGNVIGEFQYQLPVSYVKPSLKLSAKTGTVKKGADQTLSVTVLEKKSSGAYEALDLSSLMDGVALWNGSKGTAVAEAGDETGEVKLTASDAAKGKIAIQLENWAEKIELAYTVKGSSNDVLTASAKQVVMNTNAGASTADLEVKILLNNEEIDAESGVEVTMPKKWSGDWVVIDGIEDGKLTSSTLKFSYAEGKTPVKGNYTFTFKKGKGKVAVKLVVSNSTLDKAVSFKVQSKLDVTRGYKMVIIPTLKQIGGKIEDVKIADERFDIEYNEDLNQIIVAPVEGAQISKGKLETTVTVTVDGIECPIKLKTTVNAAKPTVKTSKVVLTKSSVIAGTAEADVNILSTFKQGGKLFTVAPTEVTFNGTLQDDGSYLVSDKKGTAIVSYDAESGIINVKSGANANGKMPSIKMVAKYNGGVEVKKTLSVKAK